MFLLEGVPNARELGGYILPDGRRVKYGTLYRGGSLAKATDEDIRRMKEEFHLTHVFDFRTEEEVRQAPDREVPGADNIWLPAIDPQTEKMAGMTLPKEAYLDLGNWLIWNAQDALVQNIAKRLYTDMVVNEYTQLQYAAFLQTIASTEEGGIFWHCSQGKDRTGLGAAFLLAALGADRELIINDYLVSLEFYRNDVDKFNKIIESVGGGEAEKQVVLAFIGVNVAYFTAALDLIDRQYGSLFNYVKGPLCLKDSEIKKLRARYTEI